MTVEILIGDVREQLREMPDESVHCVVTSPPYWGLRCYGVEGQIGQEPTLGEHIEVMVDVFREVRRVMRPDATLWLNYGDCYTSAPTGPNPGGFQGAAMQRDPAYDCAQSQSRKSLKSGLKPKDLCMMPARVALALQADGWWLRSEIIWHKPNPMPESITDRPTSSHEKIYLLAKSQRYYFDAEAVREDGTGRNWLASGGNLVGAGIHKHQDGYRDNGCGRASEGVATGRNIRNVWTVATAPFPGAHFATFPPALIEPCIKAGCPEGGTVLDPFGGAGTTGLVADRLKRDAILIELNPEYAAMAQARIQDDGGMFAEVVNHVHQAIG